MSYDIKYNHLINLLVVQCDIIEKTTFIIAHNLYSKGVYTIKHGVMKQRIKIVAVAPLENGMPNKRNFFSMDDIGVGNPYLRCTIEMKAPRAMLVLAV